MRWIASRGPLPRPTAERISLARRRSLTAEYAFRAAARYPCSPSQQIRYLMESEVSWSRKRSSDNPVSLSLWRRQDNPVRSAVHYIGLVITLLCFSRGATIDEGSTRDRYGTVYPAFLFQFRPRVRVSVPRRSTAFSRLYLTPIAMPSFLERLSPIGNGVRSSSCDGRRACPGHMLEDQVPWRNASRGFTLFDFRRSSLPSFPSRPRVLRFRIDP